MTVMVDDRLMNAANERDFRELQELIVSAQTHEEVARHSGSACACGLSGTVS